MAQPKTKFLKAVEQAHKDKVIGGLLAASGYIVEVADHDFGELHKEMCDAIDEAVELLSEGK